MIPSISTLLAKEPEITTSTSSSLWRSDYVKNHTPRPVSKGTESTEEKTQARRVQGQGRWDKKVLEEKTEEAKETHGKACPNALGF
jgi:hypothetical protein